MTSCNVMRMCENPKYRAKQNKNNVFVNEGQSSVV